MGGDSEKQSAGVQAVDPGVEHGRDEVQLSSGGRMASYLSQRGCGLHHKVQ